MNHPISYKAFSLLIGRVEGPVNLENLLLQHLKHKARIKPELTSKKLLRRERSFSLF